MRIESGGEELVGFSAGAEVDTLVYPAWERIKGNYSMGKTDLQLSSAGTPANLKEDEMYGESQNAGAATLTASGAVL